MVETLTIALYGGSVLAGEQSFDATGRLWGAAFAQTLQSGRTAYDASYPASSRGRLYVDYDPAGRTVSYEQYWDVWTGSSYNNGGLAQTILGNGCTYHPVSALKTENRFYKQTAPGSTAWNLVRTETFGYDADDDTLTSANYGDGLPGASVSWTYDPMGNRNDAVCDNLNRASSIGGVSMTHDILGNRLTRGTGTYQWDLVNRLTEVRTGTGLGQRTTNFAYRADGMRVHKWGSAALGSMTQPIDLQGTLYRYDGQMLIEEHSDDGTYQRFGVGARGIEVITNSAGTDSYPLYDAHGNMVATLSRAGNGGFSFAGERSYDAWGLVRSGGSSGAPSQRYCASLGHVQDDETGLVYMRARYYEPGSGRFVSEDPARDGGNWFVYCANSPVGRCDPTGKRDVVTVGSAISGLIGLNMALGSMLASMRICSEAYAVGAAGITFLVAWFGLRWEVGNNEGFGIHLGLSTLLLFAGAFTQAASEAASKGPHQSVKTKAVAVVNAYGQTLSMWFALESAMELFEANPR